MFVLFLKLCGVVSLLLVSSASSAFAGDLVSSDQAPILRETFEAWTVGCRQVSKIGGKVGSCSLSQQQMTSQGQRLLTIEFWERLAELGGLLILPFGLEVSQGVSISVDDAPGEAVLPFYTCLSRGCLVKWDVDAGFLAALRSGKVLFVQAQSRQGKTLRFEISLEGFSAAHDRLTQLMR